MDAGTGLVHIAPGHGEEDYELGRSARAARSTTRWTTTGASSPRSSTSPGRRCGRRTRRSSSTCAARGALVAEVPLDAHVSALLALQEPDAVPRHRAVVHRARQATACASARSTRSGTTCAGSPAGARSASTTWSRTARTGSSRASACGACRSWPSTARAATALLARGARWSSTWPGSSATGAGADEWYAREAASCCPPGTRCPKCGGDELPQGDRHPRRVVRLGLQPRRRARDAARAALAGRDVPRGLGPAPRLVPLLAARGGGHARRSRPTAPCSPTASWWTARGGRCRSRVGNDIAPEELLPEVRRRGPAPVGGRRGLHRGHPRSPTRS